VSGQLSRSYFWFAGVDANVPTGLTAINAYNTYIPAPTYGTSSNIALGAENLSIGYTDYSPPTLDALFRGKVGIAQTTELDVYGTSRSQGIAPVSETITSSTALSVQNDSIIDSRASALTVTLADSSNTDQNKLVRLLNKFSMNTTVSCSRGSFKLTPNESARRLRFLADGWQVDESFNNSCPTSFYPTAQAAAVTSSTGEFIQFS
jgi:hypothetical protein